MKLGQNMLSPSLAISAPLAELSQHGGLFMDGALSNELPSVVERLRLDNRAFLDALSQTSTFADFGILQTQFELQREDLGFLRTSSIADALPNLQSLLQMSVELTQNLPTFEHDNGDRVRSPDDTIDRNQKLSTDAAAEGPRVHW